MIDKQEDLTSAIVYFCKMHCKQTKGIMVYGSFIEKNTTDYSDVDIFVEDFEALSKEGDILLVMSNGDFSDLSNKVIERFKNE